MATQLPKILFAITLLFATHSYSSNQSRERQVITDIVSALTQTCFPDLEKIKIEIRQSNDPSTFFETRISGRSLIRSAPKRTYVLCYNPELFVRNLSLNAMIAILSHELNHIRDYTRLSSVEVLSLGIKYTNNPKFRAQYERKTDEKSLEMGFGAGLIDYRNWLYENIPAKEISSKKTNYWTPEEIQQWLATHAPQHNCSQGFAL